MKMPRRFKNYGLWTALGALVVMALNDFAGITPDQTEPYVDTVLLILAGAGVVINPSKGKGFKDKPEYPENK